MRSPLGSLPAVLLLAATRRAPQPVPRAAHPHASTSKDETLARLIVCVNTNICGRRNPTFVPGYGYAFKAIDCLGVLGPPWLDLRAGPCFVRCSRGVNARLVGNKKAALAAGLEPLRSRDLFRLNSVDACVTMLEEDLDWAVDPTMLAAYRAYAEALILLDDVFAAIEGISPASRANEAMPLLDAAASYVLELRDREAAARGTVPAELRPAAAFARVTADLAQARGEWRGSLWRESFYKTQMTFESVEESVNEAGEGGGDESGGGERVSEGCGAQATASYGRTVQGSDWRVGPQQVGLLLPRLCLIASDCVRLRLIASDCV